MKGCGAACMSAAAVTALASVAFMAIAFTTDNWLHISVDRPSLLSWMQANLNMRGDHRRRPEDPTVGSAATTTTTTTTTTSTTTSWFDFPEITTDLSMEWSLYGLDKESFQTDGRFFDRVRGIFRVCFPFKQRPEPVVLPSGSLRNKTEPSEGFAVAKSAWSRTKLYLNPVDEWCTNADPATRVPLLFMLPGPPAEEGSESEYSNSTEDMGLKGDSLVWLHLARSAIAAICLYFLLALVACMVGLVGCWRASGKVLKHSATVMLFSAMSSASGMCLWHVAWYYEQNKVYDSDLAFFSTWPHILKDSTKFTLGWSYMVAWTGVALAFTSALSLGLSSVAICSELRRARKEAVRMVLQAGGGGPRVSMDPQMHHRHHPKLHAAGGTGLGRMRSYSSSHGSVADTVLSGSMPSLPLVGPHPPAPVTFKTHSQPGPTRMSTSSFTTAEPPGVYCDPPDYSDSDGDDVVRKDEHLSRKYSNVVEELKSSKF